MGCIAAQIEANKIPKLKMILLNSNLVEWKKALDERMQNRYGMYDFSTTQSDDEWLDNYLGKSIDDAIEDEVENWEGE